MTDLYACRVCFGRGKCGSILVLCRKPYSARQRTGK